jgi:uncharacterized protein YggU (UPF0235/DUF167 family)
LTDTPTPLALIREADGVRFHIHVTPSARSERIGPAHGDALRVGVTAPAVDGKANAACRDALARALEVSRSAVHLDPASKGRRKRVRVDGDAAALIRHLIALADEARLR